MKGCRLKKVTVKVAKLGERNAPVRDQAAQGGAMTSHALSISLACIPTPRLMTETRILLSSSRSGESRA